MKRIALQYGIINVLVCCICLMVQTLESAAQKTYPIHQVPVLCYHQVRPHTAADGKQARLYTVTPELFAAHMRMLHDSGFHPILPARLYDHYTNGTPLPPKPVVITFDDNTVSQFNYALPVLNQYGFKAVFFVMTVTIGKPGYMNHMQLRQLHAEGHTLGCHTWDHPDLRKIPVSGWAQQLDKPLNTLADITGEPVYDFAYPYGAWNVEALRQLQQRDIRMAFILSNRTDSGHPLLTYRRLMVVHPWSAAKLYREMRRLSG